MQRAAHLATVEPLAISRAVDRIDHFKLRLVDLHHYRTVEGHVDVDVSFVGFNGFGGGQPAAISVSLAGWRTVRSGRSPATSFGSSVSAYIVAVVARNSDLG